MYFRIFRKSICFRSQLSSLPVSCQDFKKENLKVHMQLFERKDSGNVNVTGQNSNNFWWLHDERKEGQKPWSQVFEMKYVPNTSSNANRKIQSHRFKWQRNIAIIWISIVESPLDQYWFTSSILQIFKGLFNYFNWTTHSPSKLRPSQIMHIYSKPNSNFLRAMCIVSGLLNFFNWKVQNLIQM